MLIVHKRSVDKSQISKYFNKIHAMIRLQTNDINQIHSRVRHVKFTVISDISIGITVTVTVDFR